MPVSQCGGTRRQDTLVRNRSSMLNQREERSRAYERRKINPRSSDRYHREGEEEIRILGMPYEKRRGKDRGRENQTVGGRPLWINYPESSRGAAPWRIASTPSHVFVNSHCGPNAGCRFTALKYLSIIRSVRESRAASPREPRSSRSQRDSPRSNAVIQDERTCARRSPA